MSDIVERLRDHNAVVLSGLYHAIPAMNAAAAEIEHLRLEHQHACQEISVAIAERDDLLKANQLLQAFIGNRDKKIDRLHAVAWAAQGLLNADTYVSDVPREQAVREATLKLQQALGTWQMHHTAKASTISQAERS